MVAFQDSGTRLCCQHITLAIIVWPQRIPITELQLHCHNSHNVIISQACVPCAPILTNCLINVILRSCIPLQRIENPQLIAAH